MKSKLLALALGSALLAGCDSNPSQLEGTVVGGKVTSGGGESGKLLATLRSIDERLQSLEKAHAPGGTGELSALERIHRIEASLSRREEALGFLEMAYQQQKRQEEMKEAQELDPTGIYAVDISKAVKAGQVEGPNSAIVTIVEAWDFA